MAAPAGTPAAPPQRRAGYSFMSTLLAATAPLYPFISGGVGGGIAITAVMPVDNVKVRMQLAGEAATHGAAGAPRPPPATFTGMLTSIARNEGVAALYTGLSAGWARQALYGSSRIGLFRVGSERLVAANHGAPLPLYEKAALGMVVGGVASVIGNPADLALVRMQADALLPPAQRRGYHGITNAIVRIVREEGVLALWRGSTPTVMRAVFLNMALLATSDQLKEVLAPYLGASSLTTLFISSMLAGVAAAVASLPFDMVKTRLQRMAPGPDGRMPYAGIADCMRKIVAAEGPAALYTGLWPTYVLRIGPYGFVTLVASDLITASLHSMHHKLEMA